MIDLDFSDRLDRLQASRRAAPEELRWVYFWREFESVTFKTSGWPLILWIRHRNNFDGT